MSKEIICIMCPLGCNMKVQTEGRKVVEVQGNRCKKGVKHAEQEIFSPGRILTTTMRTPFSEMPLLPVRSNKEIPKQRLLDCVRAVSEQSVSEPVKSGQTIVKNILGLGVDIIACRTISCKLPDSAA